MRIIVPIALIFSGLVYAQSAPSIATAYAKESVVNGSAAAGSGPVTIYNIQFPARAKVGTGVVDASGKFAVPVKSPLVQGHGLVVVDAAGRTSARFNVAPARSGDAPGKPPGQ